MGEARFSDQNSSTSPVDKAGRRVGWTGGAKRSSTVRRRTWPDAGRKSTRRAGATQILAHQGNAFAAEEFAGEFGVHRANLHHVAIDVRPAIKMGLEVAFAGTTAEHLVDQQLHQIDAVVFVHLCAGQVGGGF